MSRIDVEAMLRAGPPDEPGYPGGLAALLDRRGAGHVDPTGGGAATDTVDDSELVPVAPARLPGGRGLRRTLCAAAVAVLVVALYVVGRPTSAPPPSQPPPVPTTAPRADATVLFDRWVGAPRPLEGIDHATGPAFVEMDGQVFLFHTGDVRNPTAFGSTMRVDGDRIIVTLNSEEHGCSIGARGTYHWVVSADGATLTLVPVTDACAARTAVAGRYVHTDCPLPGTDCLGPVPAGEYASVSFDPFGNHAYGQVRYRVPAGWSSSDDSRVLLQLRPTAPDAGSRRIDLWADPVLGECAERTPVSRATFDGRSATQFIVTGSTGCQGPVLRSGSDAPQTWSVSPQVGERLVVTVVDLGAGHSVAVVSVDAGPDEADAATSAIVHALRFVS